MHVTKIPSADTDAWTLAEGEWEGRPTMLRYRPSLSEFIGHPAYPRRLTISWEYGDDGESGMPDPGQSEALESFENCLIAALDPDRTAVLAFVYTSCGVREWNYYLSDVRKAGTRINEALRDQPGLPIHLETSDDSDWDEFSNLLESVSASAGV